MKRHVFLTLSLICILLLSGCNVKNDTPLNNESSETTNSSSENDNNGSSDNQNNTPCAHKQTQVVTVTAATCTKDGKENVVCKSCNEIIKSNVVTATGHNFQNDQCTYCGEVNKTRFTNELAAHYSADEKNGYSIWWSSDGKDYCVDYYGYKTFVFDDGEESLSNVYNSAVITEIGQKQRLRSAVDGKILFTTENAVNTEILIPYYNENKFFRDGYIFVYTKTESYNGVTYEIGFMNPQGEWIVPLSESNPILETINDEATVQYFSKSLMYCGEGMMSFGVNNEYYLYNIKENTVCRILNNGKPSNNDVKITLSEGISFKDGCSVESYGYGVGYYKLYTDGTMERINIDYHDDCHEREGYVYFDRTQNRYIAIGYTYHTEGFSIFDSKGSIIKRIPDINLVATKGFFSNGTAPIILSNKEGTTYYTILDIDGNFLFDPVKINTNTVCDIYGNEVYISLSASSSDYTIIDNSGKILLETDFVYDFGMNNGVVKYKESYNGSNKYVDIMQ